MVFYGFFANKGEEERFLSSWYSLVFFLCFLDRKNDDNKAFVWFQLRIKATRIFYDIFEDRVNESISDNSKAVKATEKHVCDIDNNDNDCNSEIRSRKLLFLVLNH